MKRKIITVFFILAMCFACSVTMQYLINIPAQAGLISKPHTFTPGSARTPSSVNENFDTIYNEFNGNINSANIQNNSILDADINAAGIFSAGKVTDTALIGVNWSDLTDSGTTTLHTHAFGGATTTASNVAIVDTGGYYTATNVEGALQEVGVEFASITAAVTSNTASGGWAYYGEGATVTVPASTFSDSLMIIWRTSKGDPALQNCWLMMDGVGLNTNCPHNYGGAGPIFTNINQMQFCIQGDEAESYTQTEIVRPTHGWTATASHDFSGRCHSAPFLSYVEVWGR